MTDDTALLRQALNRIEDMLQDDDGQAFKEARKFADIIRARLDGEKMKRTPWFPMSQHVGDYTDQPERRSQVPMTWAEMQSLVASKCGRPMSLSDPVLISAVERHHGIRSEE